MTATETAAQRPVITGWAAVSPFGIDRKNFLDGVVSGSPAHYTTDAGAGVVPGERGFVVPGFNIREILGRKGTRTMDKVTALALTAVGQLFDGVEGGGANRAPEGAALVLGTTTGSAQSMMDFTRSSMLGDRPFDVDPASMPNTVMNCAAGRCAIWYRLTGPNVTLAAGRPSGLIALRYAGRLLASERADTVLVGAAEEFSSDRSWLEFHSRTNESARGPLGEGACVLLMERAGEVPDERVPLAEVLSIQSRVYPEGDLTETLTDCVRAALTEAGADTDQLWAIVPSGAGGWGGLQENEVLASVFAEKSPRWIDVAGLIGDTGAATAAFQIAAALGVFAHERPETADIVVVTSLDTDGTVACAVLRLFREAV
jgi:3-oxoacyl-[acyl-carrier-protein] synthase II